MPQGFSILLKQFREGACITCSGRLYQVSITLLPKLFAHIFCLDILTVLTSDLVCVAVYSALSRLYSRLLVFWVVGGFSVLLNK